MTICGFLPLSYTNRCLLRINTMTNVDTTETPTRFLGAACAILFLSLPPSPRDIYGEDDRYELHEIGSPKVRAWASAVAAMVPRSLIDRTGKFKRGMITLSRSLQDVSRTQKPRLLPVAPDERFGGQPCYGVGTGFLVAPDLIVTAGHCVKAARDLKKYYWVYGYQVDPKTQEIRFDVGWGNVFEASEIVETTGFTKADRSKHDYALVRLSRSATRNLNGTANGRKTLRVRRSGKVADGAKLVMIGHPLGLPLKGRS